MIKYVAMRWSYQQSQTQVRLFMVLSKQRLSISEDHALRYLSRGETRATAGIGKTDAQATLKPKVNGYHQHSPIGSKHVHMQIRLELS